MATKDTFRAAIEQRWSGSPGEKAERYVGQFSNTIHMGNKIVGKVRGNYGIYTVSIWFDDALQITSTCSCYIGKHGFCHHCTALAITFLKSPTSFQEVKTKQRNEVQGLSDLGDYLRGVMLESLLKDLKTHGITQKAFAESIGMNPKHLSSIRSSELRNHFFNELGATKLACLWVLEHFKDNP